MKAYQIVEWGAPLEEREVPVPEPTSSEVLIKVKACGICHSDIHIWNGYFDLGDGEKITLEERGVKLPFTMGHESVGVVAAVGPEAEGVAVGDRRIVYPWIGCGKCAVCQRGDELLCMTPRTMGTRRSGGYAEYCLVPHPKYLVPCDGIADTYAAICACAGISAYSALKKVSSLRDDESLLIIGAGGVGLAAIGMAEAIVNCKLVAADIDPAKRAAALVAGAHATIDNGAEDALGHIKEATDGGPNAVIDCVGAPATSSLAVKALAKGGSLVVLGLYGGAMSLSLSMLPLKYINLVGTYVGSLGEMHELVELVKDGKTRPIPITPRPLSDAPQAIQDLRDGKAVGRFVLTAS